MRSRPRKALLVYHAESVAALEAVRLLAAFLRDVCSVHVAVCDTDVGTQVGERLTLRQRQMRKGIQIGRSVQQGFKLTDINTCSRNHSPPLLYFNLLQNPNLWLSEQLNSSEKVLFLVPAHASAPSVTPIRHQWR